MVKRFFEQIFSALLYLQQKDFGHRDIKPLNIIYFLNNSEYTFKIADFGIGIYHYFYFTYVTDWLAEWGVSTNNSKE